MNTPETDNAADGGNYVHIVVAQRLELERDEMKKALIELIEQCMDLSRNTEYWTDFHNTLAAARTTLTQIKQQQQPNNQ